MADEATALIAVADEATALIAVADEATADMSAYVTGFSSAAPATYLPTAMPLAATTLHALWASQIASRAVALTLRASIAITLDTKVGMARPTLSVIAVMPSGCRAKTASAAGDEITASIAV